ncbi:P-loop containing nucleoside triphosphate hydrolase protein [Exophiala viscosa]|uniref:P-loop containing nucleoside triphosphate hydrolase protein n=1 Tax=Exophiala viscosa TaxID=2486360 RepID=UPI002192687C|nr:P-loop containing nucleoside triphosphate hydrolase protein [Exophiala viscosa]
MAPLKPIFCATHPRACSTAFERVFMTRKDLACVHEPFGDAFYYGPERMSVRYEKDEETRKASGFNNSTYKSIFDQIEEGSEGKRTFIKDITYYLLPPDQQPAKIAPSLDSKKRGIGTETVVNGVNGSSHKPPFPYPTEGEPGNPTIVPQSLLEKFHFTFLIRDPHSSIPSYYRCCIPPLDKMTGFYEFYPSEAGYDELRRFFDYTREAGLVGNQIAGESQENVNGSPDKPEICMIDADELLDDPEGVLRVYCKSVGLEFSHDMLNWDNEEDHARAKAAFEKWKGFHEDAIDSKDLKPRAHKKAAKTEAEWDAEWKEKYGEKAAKVIRDTVDANMADYHYLKQFVLKKA